MLSTITIQISRTYYYAGYIPYSATCETHNIKNGGSDFSSFKKLKDYYQIKKIKKAGTGWAINSRGKKIEWIEYEAEISKDYIIKK